MLRNASAVTRNDLWTRFLCRRSTRSVPAQRLPVVAGQLTATLNRRLGPTVIVRLRTRADFADGVVAPRTPPLGGGAGAAGVGPTAPGPV